MKDQQNIWVGVDQLKNDEAYQKQVQNEFFQLPVAEPEQTAASLKVEGSRRDFLKYLGFGVGAATLAAGCEIPVKKAIPYVVKPDAIVPGVATYFASTFVQGGDYCPVLVKTREGRPIKIEGNSLSKITMGGTSARAQASVLSLYDTSRLDGPYRLAEGALEGAAAPWTEIDAEIGRALNASSRIRIVANTIMSPATKQAIADFQAAFPNTELVMYDPVSSSALLQANQASFGTRAVPSYYFDRAKVIVGFDADFLGTWISPIEYAAQYAKNRKLTDGQREMSRHIQVESGMSLTGSNADHRILVKPSEQGAAIVTLYNALAGKAGRSVVRGTAELSGAAATKLESVAEELWSQRGSALVVSGSNNQGEQILVNAINDMLGSYGSTINLSQPSMQRQGDDAALQKLVRDLNAGSVDAIFVLDGANPAYDIPNAAEFVAGMANVDLSVSFAGVPNETSMLCQYVTPTHHYLESWGDVEPKLGSYSLIQPTIAPIFASLGRPGTRQTEVSLLTWANSDKLNKEADQPMMEYLKSSWEQNMFGRQNNFTTFQAFWDSALHDGVFETNSAIATLAPAIDTSAADSTAAPVQISTPLAPVGFSADVNAAAGKVRQAAADGMEINFFETVNMGSGQYANNPWLMEMPDPITRCVWGNYLAIPVKWDGGNSFSSYNNLNGNEMYSEADLAEVKINGAAQTITCIRQFGQLDGTFALAIGYGREKTGMMGRALGEKVGIDVYPWLSVDADGNTQYYATGVEVSDRLGKDLEFACVQYHHTMGVTAKNEAGEVLVNEETGEPLHIDEKTVMTLGEGFQGGLTNRSIIYQGSLEELDELVEHIHHRREEAQHLNSATLYPYDEYNEKFYSQGHHWGLHVDLNACIGCGACQVACIAENNVPIVGKHEVHRHHEMTWLRIDRYYFGDYENPNVVYQPMMCQHCDNAPCENVCPVAATNHSSEGLNQMTYNRCIGTRYCANNCPYKVRRFNWLDYTTADLFSSNEPLVNGEELPFGADNLTRMVLNPDVTVRSRGVIEKCSFCVQRIQEGKLTAKREQRALHDYDVKTACQTACPTGAITFGDQNNSQGELAKKLEHPLNYEVLEEINTRPSVFYSAKVVNSSEELA